jgi:hypothetical protein
MATLNHPEVLIYRSRFVDAPETPESTISTLVSSPPPPTLSPIPWTPEHSSTNSISTVEAQKILMTIAVANKTPLASESDVLHISQLSPPSSAKKRASMLLASHLRKPSTMHAILKTDSTLSINPYEVVHCKQPDSPEEPGSQAKLPTRTSSKKRRSRRRASALLVSIPSTLSM